jgi:hypothetical protein
VHDRHPVLARRFRIWADGIDSDAVWHTAKDRDNWAAPAAGYRGAAEPEPFTFTFNP